LLLVPGAAWAAPSGREIMVRNEEMTRHDDITAAATLTTGGGGSAERVKQFTWWRKLRDDKTRYNTLTRFHVPAEVRGEGILFLERGANDNEVLLYLPTFKKIRRVESQQQNGSFMGSDLSYSDIAPPHADEYAQKVLRTESCPGAGVPRVSCFVVESTPGSPAVRERIGYSRTLSWVREDNFVVVRGEYYGLEGKLAKKMEATEVAEVDVKKHRWMALRIDIENAVNHHFTRLQFAQVKVNQGMSDATFTQQNLSRE
jgi:outer membrane lipoprotein-sorting protein